MNDIKLFDINNSNNDKFIHALWQRKNNGTVPHPTCHEYNQFKIQSKYDFRFIPLSHQVMPENHDINTAHDVSVIETHKRVKHTGLPNFLGAGIPIKSQLNTKAWQELLHDYWDKQLLQFIKFGFPLGFNRNCVLNHTSENHKYALEHPEQVKAYIDEELKLDALIGPFHTNLLENSYCSPFMTRPKANSEARHVIMDLSWPTGYSVNDGVDKDSYLESNFSLTFPTVDHLTDEMVKIGRGAHIFKVDVSRTFRHFKVDPLDIDLLGLNWENHYVDTCVPFGKRHESQFLQRTSDAVRCVMRRHGRDVIIIAKT